MATGLVGEALGNAAPVSSAGAFESASAQEPALQGLGDPGTDLDHADHADLEDPDLDHADLGRATLGLRVHDGGPSALVIVDGELDVATSSLLQALLDDLLRTKRAPRLVRLVVQTTGITFVDAAGMSPLLHARAVVTRRGGSFELRDPSAPVSRLLSLLALDGPDASAPPPRKARPAEH